uniref:hypothetical protein n=1 Tax=Thermococcus sp. 26/2 TaxID=758583 RepID=UPI0037DD9BA5
MRAKFVGVMLISLVVFMSGCINTSGPVVLTPYSSTHYPTTTSGIREGTCTEMELYVGFVTSDMVGFVVGYKRYVRNSGGVLVLVPDRTQNNIRLGSTEEVDMCGYKIYLSVLNISTETNTTTISIKSTPPLSWDSNEKLLHVGDTLSLNLTQG